MKAYLLLLILVLLYGSTFADGESFSITFTGTILEDAHMDYDYPNKIYNYGGFYSGTAFRKVFEMYEDYSTYCNCLFRPVGLDDSVDAHTDAGYTAVPDSAFLDLRVYASQVNGTESLFVYIRGVSADRDWLEGNGVGHLDTDSARDCECCADYARRAGYGTCADETAWSSYNGTGENDLCGTYSDSLIISEGVGDAWGDQNRIPVDTSVMNCMYSNGNGLNVLFNDNNSSRTYTYYYAGEALLTGYADSIPVLTLYYSQESGGEPEELPKRRRRLLR